MKNKRGITNVHLILMIVGVLILLAIVGGIIMWNLGEENRPAPISEACQAACDNEQKTAFCNVERSLNDGTKSTCETLASQNKFGVELCPTISCVQEEIPRQTCENIDGTWETPVNGNCPAQEGKFVRKLNAEDSPPEEDQLCCYYYG